MESKNKRFTSKIEDDESSDEDDELLLELEESDESEPLFITQDRNPLTNTSFA